MDFKEYLVSKGVTEEQASEIVGGMPEEEFYLSSEEKLDERYAKLKEQKEQLEEELSETNSTFKELKENHADVEELQKTIADHETKVEELEQEKADQAKEFALKTALNDVGALDVEYFADKLKSDVELDEEGTLTGFDDVIKDYQTKHPALFKAADKSDKKNKGGFRVLGNDLDGGERTPNMTREEINKIDNPEERIKAIQENKDLYKKG